MDAELPDEWAGERGDQKRAIETLTGHPARAALISTLSDSDFSSILRQAQEQKSIVVLNTAPGLGNTDDGFKLQHAFTVMDVSQGDNGLQIKVRDPRGKGADRPDGTMQISLSTLRSNFNALVYEVQ